MATVAAKDDPSTQSSEYKAMVDDWTLIADVLAGARRIREQGTKYLPKYQKESTGGYETRLAGSSWRPEFEDALRSLCSKPFSKMVSVNEGAPEVILGKVVDETTKERKGGLVDDIDGQGNSLHVFARNSFFHGVGFGLEAIYVSYPDIGPVRTVADQKAIGARPYWVHVRAIDIIDLKFRVIAGRTVVSHIRMKECTKEQDGFAEVDVDRIRVAELDVNNQPIWKLYKKGDKEYALENEGTFSGVTEIPVALFFSGERSGNYRVKPPLADLANMQIELYRAMSRKDNILTLTGSPMLKGKGFNPPAPTPILDGAGNVVGESAPQIEVGPGVVLFAPAAAEGVQPDWDYIQPNAANIKEIRDDINDIMEDFRRLALQPTTPKSGNMVATGQAIEAAKSHTAIEAWAIAFADACNQAFVFTAQWLKISDTITVSMHTDFGIDLQGTEECKVLGDAQKRGVISAKTEREELSRRGTLGPNFDEDQELQRIAEEQAGLEPEEEIDPKTGNPVETEPAI
jgi:hypothetical protein